MPAGTFAVIKPFYRETHTDGQNRTDAAWGKKQGTAENRKDKTAKKKTVQTGEGKNSKK